jgi:hypothetical protein
MTCDDVRARLTAYLDGDSDPDRGTVIRGHLRTCDACRKVAEQEALLRDELRALPTLDPPSGMWSNIAAQLAAAEVAESKRPAWKRFFTKWTPMFPRFAVGGVLAVATVGIVWWRLREPEQPKVAELPTKVVNVPLQKLSPSVQDTSPCNLDAPPGTDVTADLRGEPARVTACYAQTASELTTLASDMRDTWSDAQRGEFDAQVAELRKAVDAAEEGRPRQRAYRALNRYLQQAVTSDRVALASGGVQ